MGKLLLIVIVALTPALPLADAGTANAAPTCCQTPCDGTDSCQ